MSQRPPTDCTGRYRLLFEHMLAWPDELQPRAQKLLSTAIGQYRPLPQARAFHYSRARNKHAIGGNRCLGPDTRIESPDGAPRRVADIKGVHRVWAWDGSKRVPATASEPWIKGIEPCYRVTLSNGDHFDCSAEHRLLSPSGWRSLVDIVGCLPEERVEASPSLRESTSDIGLSTRGEGAPRYSQTPQDSQCGCRSYSCFCDVLPRYAQGIAQDASPSQADAPTRNRRSYERVLLLDDRDNRSIRSRNRSQSDHPSSWDVRCHSVVLADEPQSHVADRASISADRQFQAVPPPIDESCQTESTRESDRSATVFLESTPLLISPIGKSISIISVTAIGLKEIYDMEVEGYHNYATCSCAHHNSSKSESLLVDGLLQALDLHPVISRPKPMNIWYASKTFQLIGQFLYPKLEKYLADWPCTWSWHSRKENIPASVRINNHYRDALITFRAYEQGRETFQAAELDLALFDEQYPEDIYIETQTRKGAGRLLYFGSAVTPIDPQPWYEELIMGKLPSNMEVFNYPLDDNRTSRGGFIADEEIDAMIEIWPEEVVETRRNGKFGSYIGAIYQSFARTTHVVPEDMEHIFLTRTGKNGQTIIDPRSYGLGSIDWGGANPFCFLWGCRIPHMDDAWYIFDEYYWDSRKRGQRRLEDHATEIKTRTSERWETVLARTYADHDPTDAYEMFGHGVPSTPAEKSVKPGIEHMQTLFKLRRDHAHPWIPGVGRPRVFIAERCENLVRQLSTYHWSEGVSGKNAKEEPAKVDDHACFVASTRIDTLRGKVAINEVKVGDMALTREGYRKVTHVMRTSPDVEIIGRAFSDGTYLYGTANHPIWVVGLGWKPLGELTLTDLVFGVGDRHLQVLPMATGAKRQPVFNITVDHAHEYFANGVLVANCDGARYMLFSDRMNGPDGGTIEVLDTSGESWNQRTF